MKQVTRLHYLASLFMLVTLFTFACGSKEGKVEGVNMLYGTESKVWKTHKEKDASGDKVKQTDAQEDEQIRFYANGQYNMTSQAQTVNGKYTFDQANKKITMTPENGNAANTFDVVTLTDDRLTLRSPEGAELQLEKE
ncbi:lipocalin family protein [Hymenobacter koreensis]|uniref:Lipocalin-like domain-containing protein n=1 Tax=Hymenobacter koreensis TaxID=1084523 RepID=A0ABP8J0G9_9BACT